MYAKYGTRQAGKSQYKTPTDSKADGRLCFAVQAEPQKQNKETPASRTAFYDQGAKIE